MNQIGETIKKIRQEKKLSQTEVAVKLGVSVAALSKMETGFSKVSLSRLEQISELFKIPLNNLIEGNLKLAAPTNLIEEVEILRKKLAFREEEVMHLQKKVIELLEELNVNRYNTMKNRDDS